MAEILQPQPNESIYDPTCGSGGMLVKCLDYLRNKGEEWQSVQVFGQRGKRFDIFYCTNESLFEWS